MNEKEYKRLNNFYWFFSLDLKSSKQTTQSIITKWILNNYKYNHKSWDFDLTAKRIISWLSCHNLTYQECEKKYKDKEIPRPSHWNGYLVKPQLIEFWQEMLFRIHDRVVYTYSDNSWKIKRLYP